MNDGYFQTRKVVVNSCHGGFGLSKQAMDEYCSKKNINPGKWREDPWLFYEDISYHEIARDDPVLVNIVETMGDAANAKYSNLQVTEIPFDVKWEINEYDGSEWIAEVHRRW